MRNCTCKEINRVAITIISHGAHPSCRSSTSVSISSNKLQERHKREMNQTNTIAPSLCDLQPCLCHDPDSPMYTMLRNINISVTHTTLSSSITSSFTGQVFLSAVVTILVPTGPFVSSTAFSLRAPAALARTAQRRSATAHKAV